MPIVHQVITGIVCMLVVGSTTTTVTAGETVPATAQANSSTTEPHERGRYLVKITGCNDCHTPGYAETGGKIPEKDWLTGDSRAGEGPGERPMPATSGYTCHSFLKTNGSRSHTQPSFAPPCRGLPFTT